MLGVAPAGATQVLRPLGKAQCCLALNFTLACHAVLCSAVLCCALLCLLPGLEDYADSGIVVSVPHLQRLDWNSISGVIALQPGSQLQVNNLDMSNFALKSDYVYSPTTPYQSVGSGVSIWPTINGAPNTTFLGYNITGSYYNPSDVDDCQRYVEKTLAFLIQVSCSRITCLHKCVWQLAAAESSGCPS